MTTAPWLADAVVRANEVRRGNPTTTPPATTARRSHWLPRGRGSSYELLRMFPPGQAIDGVFTRTTSRS